MESLKREVHRKESVQEKAEPIFENEAIVEKPIEHAEEVIQEQKIETPIPLDLTGFIDGSIQTRYDVPDIIPEEEEDDILEWKKRKKESSIFRRLRKSKIGKVTMGLLSLLTVKQAVGEYTDPEKIDTEVSEQESYGEYHMDLPSIESTAPETVVTTKGEMNRGEYYRNVKNDFDVTMQGIGESSYKMMGRMCSDGEQLVPEQVLDFYGPQLKRQLRWTSEADAILARSFGISEDVLQIRGEIMRDTIVKMPGGMAAPGGLIGMEYTGMEFLQAYIQPSDMKNLYDEIYETESSVITEAMLRTDFDSMDQEDQQEIQKVLTNIGNDIVQSELLRIRIERLSAGASNLNNNVEVIFKGYTSDTGKERSSLFERWDAEIDDLSADMSLLSTYLNSEEDKQVFSEWLAAYESTQSDSLKNTFEKQTQEFGASESWKEGLESLR